MSEEIIQIDQVDVTFQHHKKEIKAVDDVTIHINKGDIYGIVGYSGAGKSTLVRVVNLLQLPSSGKVLVDGDVIFEKGKVTLSSRDLRRKRQSIGMIFQHFNLMSQLTVRENVGFALKHAHLTKEEKEAKIDDLLQLVGLSDRADNYPAQLSGGQKQRVAIARALANDPTILISDESTSALDPKTTKQILSLLKELNRKLNLTIILITHEMPVIKDIANRVAVMQNGRLLEEGTVLDIFSDPQKDLTKDFIKTATGIEEALEKIEQQDIVRDLSPNSWLLHLKYAGNTTDEPILNSIYKQYDVTANILYGNIEILDQTPVGELIVVLSGEAEHLRQAQEAIEETGTRLSILRKGGA